MELVSQLVSYLVGWLVAVKTAVFFTLAAIGFSKLFHPMETDDCTKWVETNL